MVWCISAYVMFFYQFFEDAMSFTDVRRKKKTISREKKGNKIGSEEGNVT